MINRGNREAGAGTGPLRKKEKIEKKKPVLSPRLQC